MHPRFASDLRFQIENSPFSEDFIFMEGGNPAKYVRGLFDDSIERDEGNKAFRRKPRLVVFSAPENAGPGTKIVVRGREYTFTSQEADANLGVIIWLR